MRNPALRLALIYRRTMTIPLIGQTDNKNPDCPICKRETIFHIGKKGATYACPACKVSMSVTDPLILRNNLIKEGTMMKAGDKVLIGRLEWEVVMGKHDHDFLLRRPNPKNRKQMDFCIVEVLDFVFDKESRRWIEVETLPEDGDQLFKK